jgi:hypothetical protein
VRNILLKVSQKAPKNGRKVPKKASKQGKTGAKVPFLRACEVAFSLRSDELERGEMSSG